MRGAFLLFVAILTAAGARAQLAAERGTTNIVLASEVILEPAWQRRVVMQDAATGEIINDAGKVGRAALAAAVAEAASRAAEISDASAAAVSNALQRLVAAQANAATNSIAIALAVMPETSRSNLTAYVVQTETTNGIDTQWVWYNRQIALEPNRYVVYETHDRAATNKVAWVGWTAAGETVTVNGRTWEGCHKCTVSRPDWARGVACLDLPNDKLGGVNGFDFGDLLLTVGGVPAYTGIISNGVTGATLYFDNGFCKGVP